MQSEQKRLVADVLAEEAEPGFREALLGRTIILVRRRRRGRALRRRAALVAVLAGLVLASVHFWPKPRALPEPERGYTLVETEPMTPARLVMTRSLAPSRIVSTSSRVTVVSTVAAGVEMQQLTDQDLLALVAPSPVALVQFGPGAAELVFADPTDHDLYFREPVPAN